MARQQLCVLYHCRVKIMSQPLEQLRAPAQHTKTKQASGLRITPWPSACPPYLVLDWFTEV